MMLKVKAVPFSVCFSGHVKTLKRFGGGVGEFGEYRGCVVMSVVVFSAVAWALYE